jgi:hypothetical protein
MNFSEALRTNQPVSEFLPRYGEMVEAGVVFGVTYTAAALAAASATATGSFSLWNPAASGVALMMLEAVVTESTHVAATTTTAIQVVAVPNQQPSATTPGNTPVSLLIGSSKVAAATPYTAGTLAAAPTVAFRTLAGFYDDVAAVASTFDATKKDEIAGDVIVMPNSGIDVVSNGAGTPTIILGYIWAEIPLA